MNMWMQFNVMPRTYPRTADRIWNADRGGGKVTTPYSNSAIRRDRNTILMSIAMFAGVNGIIRNTDE